MFIYYGADLRNFFRDSTEPVNAKNRPVPGRPVKRHGLENFLSSPRADEIIGAKTVTFTLRILIGPFCHPTDYKIAKPFSLCN